jgi:hypothetical protein
MAFMKWQDVAKAETKWVKDRGCLLKADFWAQNKLARITALSDYCRGLVFWRGQHCNFLYRIIESD